VATVAAAFSAIKHPNLFPPLRTSLYTFGSPRVGDYGFSHGVFGQHVFDSWRVVHGGDLISHEPPCCSASWIPIGSSSSSSSISGGKAATTTTLSDSCLREPSCPYHTQREVWYKGDMPALGTKSSSSSSSSSSEPSGSSGGGSGSGTAKSSSSSTTSYVICNRAEDPLCDTFQGIDIQDHLSYFNESIAAYCCYSEPASQRRT
jgi:hypothetical protein